MEVKCKCIGCGSVELMVDPHFEESWQCVCCGKQNNTEESRIDRQSALNTQIGGSHYKDYVIQPFEFFMKNNIPFHKADIIKRILRYDHETGKGVEDLQKIKHEIDLIIEIQEKLNE